MVEYFIVENFLSYRDKTELSFLASKKDSVLPESLASQWYKEIDDKRLLRLLIGVGLNGTGKTKIIQGLQYLCKMATLKPENPNDGPDYHPFLLDDFSKNKPTVMELSYYLNGSNYIYSLKVSSKRIEEEELRLQGSRGQRVFYRCYDHDKDTVQVSFGIACDLNKSDQRDLELNTINNATVLSIFGSLNLESKVLRANYDYLHNRISFVRPSDQTLAEKLSTGNEEYDSRMKKLLLRLLHDINSNIVDYHVDNTSISIDEMMKGGVPDFMIDVLKNSCPSGVIEKKVLRFIHSTSQGTRSLDSSLESFGTLNIVRLMVVFYDIVLGKKCTCIDELAAGIHSLALEFILKMYLTLSDENQVVLATHDLSLLNMKMLRRDAIRVFEKNEDGVTSVERHKYVHNTVNFYKRYMTEIRKDMNKYVDDDNLFKEYYSLFSSWKVSK